MSRGGVKRVDRGGGRLVRRNERGLVLVYFVITLTVLMVASAFSVDVGAWYTRSNQLQRAVDAAALAGVSFMPNDFATAQQTALDTLKTNGVDPSTNTNLSVSITRDSTSDRRLVVTVKDSAIPQYFSKAVMSGTLSETRHATGEFLASIPIGSPENYLGNPSSSCNTGSPSSRTCVTPPGFVASINGYCASTEDGDPIASAWDGTRANVPVTTNRTINGSTYVQGQVHCPTAGSLVYYEQANSGYNSSGYTYDVDIPGDGFGKANANYSIDIWDPGYNEGGTAGDKSLSNTSATVTTLWKIYGPPDSSGNRTLLNSGTFASGSYANTWYTFPVSISSGVSSSGTYQLRLSTLQNEASSWGQNNFTLRAYAGSSIAACDSGSTCPAVHGDTAVSIYVNKSSSTANIWLAQIPTAYSGKTMVVSLFDPGEGASSVQILQPDGNPATFTWDTNDHWCKLNSSYCYSGGPTTSLAVNSLVTPMSGDQGPVSGQTYKFNDRLVNFTITLPSTTVLNSSANGEQGWWLVKYSTGSSSVTDRTTWFVKVFASPIHLVSS